ncbi:hypothetical protein V1264_003352 [Littorina saxatilis]|uniref:Uncharacterized protein n=1 Tax=Littorina saxatilis TaxID=31220 RepID=A0AAN9G870_9CAEN
MKSTTDFRLRNCLFLVCLLLVSSAAYPFETNPFGSETSRAERLRGIVNSLAAKMTEDEAVLSTPPEQQQEQQQPQRQQPLQQLLQQQPLQYQHPKNTYPPDLFTQLMETTTSSEDMTSQDLNSIIKRQQGWLATYGNRQQASLDYDVSDLEDPMNEIEEDIIKKQKRQQGWHTMYGKRSMKEGDISELMGTEAAPADMADAHRDSVVINNDNSDVRFPNLMNTELTDFISKRQQGWHTTYGKRDTGPVYPVNKRQQGWKTMYGKRATDLTNLVDWQGHLDLLQKRQQGWHTMYGKRSIETSVNKRQQGWNTMYGKRSIETPVNKRQQGWNTMYGKRSIETPANKRQQGWNTMYGKRSVETQVNKRQQGWNTMYGKRSVETPVKKRQQGWNTMYGKRSVEALVNKRQQGWNTMYGKRSVEALVNKRQQGWNTMYGKRSVETPVNKRQQGWNTMYGKRSVGTPANKRQQGWNTMYGKRAGDDSLTQFRQLFDEKRTDSEDLTFLLSALSNHNNEVQDLNDPSITPEISDNSFEASELHLLNNVINSPLSSVSPVQDLENADLLVLSSPATIMPGDVPRSEESGDGNSGRWKRQQGWHTKYGKRSAGAAMPGDVSRLGESRDWNSGRWKRQQGWKTMYGKRSVGAAPLPGIDDASALENPRQNFFDKTALDGESLNSNGPRNKRQQGWNTMYGKRQAFVEY